MCSLFSFPRSKEHEEKLLFIIVRVLCSVSTLTEAFVLDSCWILFLRPNLQASVSLILRASRWSTEDVLTPIRRAPRAGVFITPTSERKTMFSDIISAAEALHGKGCRLTKALDLCHKPEMTARVDEKMLSLRNLISSSISSMQPDDGRNSEGISSEPTSYLGSLCLMDRVPKGDRSACQLHCLGNRHGRCREQVPSPLQARAESSVRHAKQCKRHSRHEPGTA